MNRLETYLHRATRGLWGRKRLEVKAELRGSIEARAWQLECQGIAPDAALERASTELGAPGAIAAGLTGVHTMPKVFKNTVALGLIAAISLSAFNQSRAQIEAYVYNWMSLDAPTKKVQVVGPPTFNVYYLSLNSIKQNLEAVGVSVDDTPLGTLNGFGNQKILMPTLRFRLPGSAQTTILQSQGEVSKDSDGNIRPAASRNSALLAPDNFLAFSSFVLQLKALSGLPVRLEGWHNPKLVIGSTTLQIGTSSNPVQPWEVYARLAGQATGLNTWFSSNVYRHAVRVNAPAGSVYALVSTTQGESLPHVDVARVSNDSVLYFNAAHRVLEFSGLDELKLDFANVRKPGYGDSSRPAKAVLVRITPDLETSFLYPERRRSGALNAR